MALDWRQEEFLEWLCTPEGHRDPPTQRAFADKIGAGERTLVTWKKDPEFYAAWEKKYRKVVGSPEKAHQVLNALHETATDRSDPRLVPAARAYLEAIDAIKPKKVEVNVNQTTAKDLTDDQLLAILGERAAKELEDRQMDRAE